jgi:maltose alpha-D-glucosyltransferase/alpha-amylase
MTDPLWYKDAIFYELHVKTFHDGNDDGIGDFRGLIEKLDYLEWLGVDCLWLLPFFQWKISASSSSKPIRDRYA